MIRCLEDRGVVRLTGFIGKDAEASFIESIEHLREDGFYDRVAIEISSSSSELASFEHLQEVIDSFHRDGITVDTFASGVTGSVAVFLLSAGDDRLASPRCRLRYRLCRIQGQVDLTAAVAGTAAAALAELDDHVVNRLGERGVEAARGRRERAKLEDFRPGDWEAITQFLVAYGGGKSIGTNDRKDGHEGLRGVLKRRASGADSLVDVYRTLLALDWPISAVIDPKWDVLPVIGDLTGDVRLIERSRPGKPGSVLNLTSAPEWGLDAHMAAEAFEDAARQILVRSARLAPQSPARVWVGLAPLDPQQGYWDHAGSSLAAPALSLAVASIEHALAGMDGNPIQSEATVSVLLNNLGTKVFLSTTDEGAIRRIRSQCPKRPGRPAAFDVPLPSTLSPGERYAALPDRRFERRQLARYVPRSEGRDRCDRPERHDAVPPMVVPIRNGRTPKP